MDVSIAPLAEDDVGEAVSVLTHTFMPDPIFSYFFPRVSDGAAVFTAFFAAQVAIHSRFGRVYAARRGKAVIGAAIWRPPDAGAPTERDEVLEQRAAEHVEAIDPIAAATLLRGFADLSTHHPAEPHWYLFFVGVDPALQGHGIGEQLLTPVLQSADNSATPCYLETPFPRTHAFYRRLGFEIERVGNPFVGAPTLWTMLRLSGLPAGARSGP
jgi:ribosomal protein S18 acetylase RimI-like enzyme